MMKKKPDMPEKKWWVCSDPRPMLDCLTLTDRASERKLRLFACSCCRRIWGLLNDSCRSAVEIAERYVDGKATKKAIAKALTDVDAAYASAEAAAYSAASLEGRAAHGASMAARGAVVAANTHTEWGDDSRASKKEFQAQADYLRDIFGPLPFRTLAIEPGLFTATVRALARGIYDERAFDRLPILADSLEDAGCTNADILSHCRGPGPHVRGCWVVDLLLEKE